MSERVRDALRSRTAVGLAVGGLAFSAFLMGRATAPSDSAESTPTTSPAASVTRYDVYDQPYTDRAEHKVGTIDPSRGFDIICAYSPTEGYPLPQLNTEETYYDIVWDSPAGGLVVKGFIQAKANMRVGGYIPPCEPSVVGP